MQKNAVIALVVVLIVVVIAIVAVVFLLGNGGPSRQVLPPVPNPVTPPAQGNVVCTLSGTMGQASVTGTMKYKSPNKALLSLTAQRQGQTANIEQIEDGNTVYALVLGYGWVMAGLNDPAVAAEFGEDATKYEGMSPDQVAASLTSELETKMSLVSPTISCSIAGDISDSEFALPAGVSTRTWAEYQQYKASASGSTTYNGIMCNVSGVGSTTGGQQFTYSGVLEIKKPGKMALDLTVAAQGLNAVIKMLSDGTYTYTLMPATDTWTKAALTAPVQMTDREFNMSTDQLNSAMASSMASKMPSGSAAPRISCGYVTDIPDSDFQLPAGAKITTA